jgi:hypothetical protein
LLDKKGTVNTTTTIIRMFIPLMAAELFPALPLVFHTDEVAS